MTTTKKIVALFFAIIFAISCAFPVYAENTTTKLSEEAKARIAELEAQNEKYKKEIADSKAKRKEIEGEIKDTKELAAPLQREVEALQSEISSYQKQINNLNSQISILNAQIKETDAKISKQRAKIEETQKLLGQRMRAMYMAGNTSTIELIFEADSFEDLINGIELAARIAKHDSDMIAGLKAEIADLDKLIKELEEDKITLQASKDDIVAAQAEIKANKAVVDQKVKKLESYIRSLSSKDKQLQQLEIDREKIMDRAASEIDEILRGKPSAFEGNPDGFIWPVASSSSRISSPYGTRTLDGKTKLHGGIDIAAPSNSSVLAAADGVVIMADSSCSHNFPKHYTCCSGSYGSYGRFIIIDNGKGYTTLYAHLNKVLVKKGDRVKQGDKIGSVGTTGHSTGYHLHFEVRVNGARKNPSAYVHK